MAIEPQLQSILHLPPVGDVRRWQYRYKINLVPTDIGIEEWRSMLYATITPQCLLGMLNLKSIFDCKRAPSSQSKAQIWLSSIFKLIHSHVNCNVWFHVHLESFATQPDVPGFSHSLSEELFAMGSSMCAHIELISLTHCTLYDLVRLVMRRSGIWN